jgi:hypothetical protein
MTTPPFPPEDIIEIDEDGKVTALGPHSALDLKAMTPDPCGHGWHFGGACDEGQRIALGLRPRTLKGWWFWLRYWSPFFARWRARR